MESLNYRIWITGAAQPKLTKERLLGIQIVVPPVEEQRRIVQWLEAENGPGDRTEAKARDEIGLLREYRTRLIADIVTGKLDVRQAAANLPDELDRDEPEVEDAEDLEDADDLPEEESAA